MGWWCFSCDELFDWRKTTRVSSCQLGVSVESTVSFRAHASLEGSCDNVNSGLNLATNVRYGDDRHMCSRCLLQGRKSSSQLSETSRTQTTYFVLLVVEPRDSPRTHVSTSNIEQWMKVMGSRYGWDTKRTSEFFDVGVSRNTCLDHFWEIEVGVRCA